MLHLKYSTAAEALEAMFNQKENNRFPGLVYIFLEYPSTWSYNKVGHYQTIHKSDLEDRVYTVKFMDNSVCICFHDAINFKSTPSGRDRLSGYNSDKTIRFPFI